MVETQLKPRGIKSRRVLEAMRTVAREDFVPDAVKPLAYTDRPLPIGYEQTISQPYVVAYMTQALDLEKNYKVLEIGTGSGYQAAVLSKLVSQVYTIEIVPELYKTAKARLSKLGYSNVTVKHRDGTEGWPEKGPFDAIIVTAAPQQIPESLKKQLKPGGRMIIPVGQTFQNLMRITRRSDKIDEFLEESLLPVRFVPMTGKAQKK